MGQALSHAKLKRAKRILKRQPQHREAHLALGWHAMARGDVHDACEHLEAALATQPADREVRRVLAKLYLHRAQFKAAARLYEGLLQDAAEDAELLCALGQIAYHQHDLERARAYLERASRRNPDDCSLANDLGVLCQLVGELRKAEDHFARALQLQPNSADAHFNLGVLSMETRRPAAALEHLRRVTELEPRNALAHHLRGALEAEHGAAEAAAAAYREAVALEPRNAAYRYSLAAALFSLGNLEAASEAFTACLDIEPAHAAAKHGLTACYARRGMVERARQLWHEEGASLQPQPVAAGQERWTGLPGRPSPLTPPRAGRPGRKISVLMPAYNECAHLLSNIRETERVLRDLGCDFEIIVADDGSKDDTKAVAELLAHNLDNVHVWGNGENQGKGMALRRASQAASGDLVVFLDADLELHPRLIAGLLDTMEREGADIVVGSKRHPQSRLHYPLRRRLLSTLYAAVLKLLFGLPVRDTQTGLKLFKRQVLQDVLPRLIEKQYAFDVELLVVARQLGYRIAEAPIELNFSRARSRIGMQDVLRTALDTLGIYYRLRYLRYYERPRLPLLASPSVSVVIAAGGASPYLEECLRHCAQLDYPDVEIIVLPDEPITTAQANVRIIPTGPLSPAAKRDQGWRSARGEIIAFLDDDAYPRRDWLRMAVRNFQLADVAAVGGPGVTPSSDSRRQRLSGVLFASRLVSGPYRYRYLPGTYQEVDDFPTCNLLVRAGVLAALGGCQCDYWPGEDTVLCSRIVHELGQRIIYDPDAVVFHHRRALFRAHLRQVRRYALHRGFFVKRFPATSRRAGYFLPSAFTAACAFGWLAGLVHPVGWWGYAGMLAAYAAAAALTGLSTLSLSSSLLVMAGSLATHWTYGLYFLRGLLARDLDDARQRRRKHLDGPRRAAAQSRPARETSPPAPARPEIEDLA
ncbi:MAG: glycosyltransferase [Candidatus Tectomicrobia bacterium]|nr:glycosyltransferase [Candidatus Tectomicrobia bacterium]